MCWPYFWAYSTDVCQNNMHRLLLHCVMQIFAPKLEIVKRVQARFCLSLSLFL